MKGEILGINFTQLEAERYWSFPKSYKKDKKVETKNMIFSGEYIGSRKMDGAYYRFVKDDWGNMFLLSRSRGVNGEFAEKMKWVPQLYNFFSGLPNGTCLLGELYFPNKEGSNNVTTIMGCLKEKAVARQEKEKLYYYIFDVWAYDGKSYLDEPAEKRFEVLRSLRPHPYVKTATYKEGVELWDYLQEVLEEGGEGVVITKRDSKPEPGKRTARKTLKIKKELSDTIDCIIIGANPPTKEYTGKNIEGWEYYENLMTGEKLPIANHYRDFMAGSPIIPVTKNYYMDMAGSLQLGLTDGEKVKYFGDLSGLPYEVLSDWAAYKGKVCEVTAMEITEDGRLRHPRFVQWRPDKRPSECLITQIK